MINHEFKPWCFRNNAEVWDISSVTLPSPGGDNDSILLTPPSLHYLTAAWQLTAATTWQLPDSCHFLTADSCHYLTQSSHYNHLLSTIGLRAHSWGGAAGHQCFSLFYGIYCSTQYQSPAQLNWLALNSINLQSWIYSKSCEVVFRQCWGSFWWYVYR